MTVTGRSAPPIMAPWWSNGFALSKSMTKAVFLDLVEKVTAVPNFMLKGLLDLAPGILGVAVA